MLDLDVPQRFKSESAAAELARVEARILRFSEDWNGGCGAIILGKSGIGKSLAVAFAMRRLTLDVPRYWAAWVRADVLSRIRDDREHAADLIRIKSAHVLAIDDVGYERFPDMLLEVIGERYDRELPTVVTTGLEPTAFTERYSKSAARKIVEVGNGVAINCWNQKAGKCELPILPVPDRILRLQLTPTERLAAHKGLGRF